MTEEKFERCIIQIDKIKLDIDEKKKQRNQLNDELDRKNREIQMVPGADPKTSAEISVYGTLEDIFKRAIDNFREAVREDVKDEATNIFKQLTTETDFDSLDINEQYGLQIIDSDGKKLIDRSAGAEQVVALSLVGALNRCAVREGPIIMDTPFGRLDKTHRKNILGFIPTLSSQVILLVQSGEFTRENDLKLLGNKVGREYCIERDGSPTRSKFEPLNDTAGSGV